MSSKTRRIGVFGGSFNPPHLGHLLAAVYALKVFNLDEIWFVPVYRHAFSKDLPPFSKRLTWVKNLIAGFEKSFRVSTIEKELKSDGKMLHTLNALKKKYPKCRFSLVVGSDVLKEKRKWHRFSEIEKRFGVLVVPRGKAKKGEIAIPNISSTEIRKKLSSLPS